MVAMARSTGGTGAESVVSGDIAIYADWNEDIYFRDHSTGLATDLTGLTFEFQFRNNPSDTAAVVTLSTTAGTLSIQADTGSVNSILRIAAPRGTFSLYGGDLVADLLAIDVANKVTLYAHGIVTFANNPATI